MKPRSWEILSIFPKCGNSVAGSASLLLYYVLKQASQDTTYTDFKATQGRSPDL